MVHTVGAWKKMRGEVEQGGVKLSTNHRSQEASSTPASSFLAALTSGPVGAPEEPRRMCFSTNLEGTGLSMIGTDVTKGARCSNLDRLKDEGAEGGGEGRLRDHHVLEPNWMGMLDPLSQEMWLRTARPNHIATFTGAEEMNP